MICSVNCAASNAETAPRTGDAYWARPVYERQVAMLGELAEAGLEVALALKDEVKARVSEARVAETGAEGADTAALAYARAAKAVRMTLLLQTQAIKALQQLDKAVVTDAGSGARERRARVERIVERIARREYDDADEVERVVEETAERLDGDDVYGDVMARPVSELVALICRDLGLDPDWPRLAEEAWAKAEIANGPVGAPLATGPWPPLDADWPGASPAHRPPLPRHRRTCSDDP